MAGGPPPGDPLLLPASLDGRHWEGVLPRGAGPQPQHGPGLHRFELEPGTADPRLALAAWREAQAAPDPARRPPHPAAAPEGGEGGEAAAAAAVAEAVAGAGPALLGRVTFAAPDLRELRFALRDPAGRVHVVRVEAAPDGAGAVRFAAEGCLPTQPAAPSEGGLAEVLAAAEGALAGCAPLWAALEDLDAHCHVIEPARPSYAARYRRLQVPGRNCALIVAFPDGLAPSAAPAAVQFLGPDGDVRALKERWHAGHGAWDPAAGARANLERILGVALDAPLPAAPSQDADGALTCGICYAAELDGLRPTVTCVNAACRQWFHAPCIDEYLRSSTRHTLGPAVGKCPFCGSLIKA